MFPGFVRRIVRQNHKRVKDIQAIFPPQERIIFADLIEERMFSIFPWFPFPPTDVEIDGIRCANILKDFQRSNPTVIISGHGARRYHHRWRT